MARTDWSYRMLWLTCRAILADRHVETIALASSSDMARGFWARMPRTLRGCSTIRRITPGCAAGGTATSTRSTAGSSSMRLQRVEHARNPAEGGDFLGRGSGPRGDPLDAEPGVRVGHQVAVPDDEASADDADAEMAGAIGHVGAISEFARGRVGHERVDLSRM